MGFNFIQNNPDQVNQALAKTGSSYQLPNRNGPSAGWRPAGTLGEAPVPEAPQPEPTGQSLDTPPGVITEQTGQIDYIVDVNSPKVSDGSAQVNPVAPAGSTTFKPQIGGTSFAEPKITKARNEKLKQIAGKVTDQVNSATLAQSMSSQESDDPQKPKKSGFSLAQIAGLVAAFYTGGASAALTSGVGMAASKSDNPNVQQAGGLFGGILGK